MIQRGNNTIDANIITPSGFHHKAFAILPLASVVTERVIPQEGQGTPVMLRNMQNSRFDSFLILNSVVLM